MLTSKQAPPEARARSGHDHLKRVDHASHCFAGLVAPPEDLQPPRDREPFDLQSDESFRWCVTLASGSDGPACAGRCQSPHRPESVICAVDAWAKIQRGEGVDYRVVPAGVKRSCDEEKRLVGKILQRH